MLLRLCGLTLVSLIQIWVNMEKKCSGLCLMSITNIFIFYIIFKFFKTNFSFFFQFTFPYCINLPALIIKPALHYFVSYFVPVKFILPKLFICFGHRRIFTTVQVPETSMYKNCDFLFGKNNIGLAGDIVIYPVPVPPAEQIFSNVNFRPSIL